MIAKKIRVLLFIPNLTAGGAERVMLFIAKNLNKEKFDVSLVVTGFKRDTIYDTAGLDIIYLNHKKVKNSFFKILRLFFTQKPDIAFGSLRHINYILSLVAFLFPKTIFIARETIVLSVQHAFRKVQNPKIKRKKIKDILTNFDAKISNVAHKNIDYFVCQSEDMRNDMMQIPKFYNRNLVTINNPVSNEIKTKTSVPPIASIRFITVGRLTKQKGHDRILKGLSELDFPFVYTIIGSGKELATILALAKHYKISEKVNHIAMSKTVYEHLAKSHIYLQGSYFEGFPNALIESLGIGTPAIVYEAPGGMNEIVVNGENGFLVKNDIEFKKKLDLLSQNLEQFSPAQVSSHVQKQFGWEKIISDYEQFFSSAFLDKSTYKAEITQS